MTKAPLSCILVLLVLPLVSCKTVWIEASESFEVDAAGLREIICTSGNGSVELVGEADVETIRVTVHKRVGGQDVEDAAAALLSLQIVNHTTRRSLRLGHRWHDGDGGWRAQVSFQVVYPRGLETVVETRNGGVTIRGVRQRCTVTTRNGSIDVQGALARCKLRSRNGQVRAKLASGRGKQGFDCDIATANGSVELILDRRVSAKLSCATKNGGLDSSLPLHRAVFGRHSINGILGSGAGRIKIRTRNGSVQLRSRSSIL